MKNPISENVSEFLDFLRESEQLVRISEANEQEANDATQDILHKLEIGTVTYHEAAKLAKKLAEVRQERRVAKDLYNAVSPVAQWAEENKNVIKSLERLLGDVRKAEKFLQNRTYTPKTGVLREAEA